MSFDLIRRYVAVTTMGAMLAGCGTTPRDHTPALEEAPILNRPAASPIRSMSSFSDSLSCMDTMLRDYQVPAVLITSKNIADASGKVNVGFKEMVITGLSMMSRTSGTFRYVDYEIDALRQDTVQNLTGLLLNAGQMRLQRPALYVSGALSYMDQNISIKRNGGGISATNWDIGLSNDVMTSALGLDLHIGDFGSRTLVPGVDSSNTIVVGNVALGGEAGGRIRKTGIQFNLGREVSQGTGPAVRTLIDLGLIELVGKWARVPYWQCLSLDQAHSEFQSQMRAWWDEMEATERVRLFQTALRSSGYYNAAIDGKPSASLRQSITRFQADQNVVVSGNLNFETYERFARDYVHFDGAGKFVRVGWGPADKRTAEAKGAAAKVPMDPQAVAALAPRQGRPMIDATPGAPARLSVSLNQRDGRYTVGESMSYQLSVDRQAFVYCYYRDVRRQVTQVYPNPLQRAQPVQGNQALEVPDTANPQSFTITFDQPGVEQLLCMATDQEMVMRLPPTLRGPALTPIMGVNDLGQMQAAFEKVLGQQAYGKAQASWTIVRN